MSTATQTYQQGIQSLQAWLDYLDSEEVKLQTQLAKMQGGDKSLPEIDADLPPMGKAAPENDKADTSLPDDEDDWL